MNSTPPGRRGAEQPHNIAAAIAEVSERASLLVREEIELAKAEVGEKATRLVRGAIVGVAAGIFFLGALMFALVGCAWLLYYFIPGGDFTYFWGFFAMAVILVLLGVIAGLIAARAVKRGAPPVPSMAFEEARKIRETVSAPANGGSTMTAAPGMPVGDAPEPFAPPAGEHPAPSDAPGPSDPAGPADPASGAELPGAADVAAPIDPALPADGDVAPAEGSTPGEGSDASPEQPDASAAAPDAASSEEDQA